MRVDYSLIMPHNGQLLFVEFNGPTHYTQSKTIYRDYMLRDYCYHNDIRLVEIPYFVQLNDYTICEYFGDDVFDFYIKDRIEITTPIPSGFIEKKIILPYDYCTLGLLRFQEDINPSTSKVKTGYETDAEFSQTAKEIYHSICMRSQDEIELMDYMIGNTCDNRSLTEFLKHYPT
jgi:hypothetical protein